MTPAQLETQVNYITNKAGSTSVVLPLELWQAILDKLGFDSSGLISVDEQESKESILADLKTSVKEAAEGKTYPISMLWDDETDRPEQISPRRGSILYLLENPIPVQDLKLLSRDEIHER